MKTLIALIVAVILFYASSFWLVGVASSMSPAEALAPLKEGNARYVKA